MTADGDELLWFKSLIRSKSFFYIDLAKGQKGTGYCLSRARFWYIRTFKASIVFVSAVLLSLSPAPAKLYFQSGGSALTASERRNTQRFQMRLPLTVRWTTGAAVGETSTESRDVSSRGVYFFLSKDVKQGSAIEILLTLPNEITLAGPVRVRCLGRVQRTEARDEGAIGVVAAIERYEFLRGDEDRKQ
jgi:hypothetical protein